MHPVPTQTDKTCQDAEQRNVRGGKKIGVRGVLGGKRVERSGVQTVSDLTGNMRKREMGLFMFGDVLNASGCVSWVRSEELIMTH